MKKFEIVKKSQDFDNIIHNGKYHKNEYFVIYRIPNNESIIRFGIAVGKKYGIAVQRNKIKRQIKSIIDNNKKLFPKGFDYIIMIKKGCINATFKELENSLVNLLIEKVK